MAGTPKKPKAVKVTASFRVNCKTKDAYYEKNKSYELDEKTYEYLKGLNIVKK